LYGLIGALVHSSSRTDNASVSSRNALALASSRCRIHALLESTPGY
jgi:hypothetical protein